MSMPLHHVSFRGRGSVMGPRRIRYFVVAAPTSSDALALVERELGNEDGEFAVARSERTTTVNAPAIVRASQIAA